MSLMDKTARRSWLVVPASRAARIREASQSGADVVVLDLVELVAAEDRGSAREEIRTAIAAAKAGGAEVFVQTDPAAAGADLLAAIWPGISGVVVSRAESPAYVEAIAGLLDRLELERGLKPGAVGIVPALETARGNHAAYDISRASARVWGVTLGRADLIMDLRPGPSGEIHLMPYLMQRLILIAGALRLTPIGAWWRGSDRGLLATAENTYQAARRGRAIGFKGAMCLTAGQVEPLNHAYEGRP
jgi:citrate lyase subunit beta/citryl-CoA lyase